MSHSQTPADYRDEHAADRDDAADRRDDTAHHRDDAADQRDTDATARDQAARQDSHDLADQLRRVCEQILARFARLETPPSIPPPGPT